MIRKISQDIYIFAGGEHTYFCISVITSFLQGENIFSAGEEHITYFLQGSIRAHKVSSSKRGRMLKLTFDDTFVKSYHMELYLKPIQELYMIKTYQRELIMICIVIVDSMLKALKHTHIHHSLLDDL